MHRANSSRFETVSNADNDEAPSFHVFSRQIRAELGEAGLLERVLLDRIAASAWRLSRFGELCASPGDRAESRAERSLHRSLEMLESLRCARAEFHVCPRPPVVAAERPRPAPVERMRFVEEAGDADPLCDAWRERLAFDPKTSEVSPVVKGTWVTVDHLISLIVDNWSWADILRSHPELCEDDIRSCLSYAIEQSQDETC